MKTEHQLNKELPLDGVFHLERGEVREAPGPSVQSEMCTCVHPVQTSQSCPGHCTVSTEHDKYLLIMLDV